VADAPETLTPVPPLRPAQRRERWVRWLPALGACLLLLDAAWLGAMALAELDKAKPLLLTIPLLFAAGKEAAIPAGIAAGGRPILVFAVQALTDTAATLILFPVVHLTLDGLERRKGFLGKMLRSATKRAAKHRRLVDRYGVLGLYLFAIVPFAFNGPPICTALGRLAGLRAKQVVPVLVLAIATTAAGWSIVYAVGFSAIQHVNRWIPLALSLTITAGMLLASVVSTLRERSEDAPAS